jgi:hypothetical protein
MPRKTTKKVEPVEKEGTETVSEAPKPTKELAEASKSKRFPEKPSFDQYLSDLHRRWNETGDISVKKHHPDMHSLGTSPQCPNCCTDERSAQARYEYDFP